MRKSFVFIGDDKDPMTKKWGLRKGYFYRLNFSTFPPQKSFTVFIYTPNCGIIPCPYSSVEAFKENWA